MAVCTQPTLSLGMLARIVKASTLSPFSFHKRYRSSSETPSPSSSPTLSVRKRYRVRMRMMRERESQGLDDEGQGLDDEGHGLEDEGPGMKEEEEATPEGQQQAVLVVDTAMSEPLVLRYGETKCHALESTEEISPSTYKTPPSPEWSLGSLLVSPLSPVVLSLIASPVATLAATISVDKDQFLEVGAHLELYGSILHDHTQRLDALPSTLFEGYDRDLRELYTRENYDLRRQLAKERRERLELTDHVTKIEKRQEFRGE
ncbi:hypothetical protein Tco_0867742 [Tanacetum coccineum]